MLQKVFLNGINNSHTATNPFMRSVLSARLINKTSAVVICTMEGKTRMKSVKKRLKKGAALNLIAIVTKIEMAAVCAYVLKMCERCTKCVTY